MKLINTIVIIIFCIFTRTYALDNALASCRQYRSCPVPQSARLITIGAVILIPMIVGGTLGGTIFSNQAVMPLWASTMIGSTIGIYTSIAPIIILVSMKAGYEAKICCN